MGRPQTEETRQKIRVAALNRVQVPRKKRSDTPEAGRMFARRWFPLPEWCEQCSIAKARDRHHKDGNPQNNTTANIAFLCRRCHQILDGRHERLKHEIPSMGGKARAGRGAA